MLNKALDQRKRNIIQLFASGLMAHNFIKVSLLQTLIKINDYDITFPTETFLGSLIDNDDDRISISGYHRISISGNTEEVFVFITRAFFLL